MFFQLWSLLALPFSNVFDIQSVIDFVHQLQKPQDMDKPGDIIPQRICSTTFFNFNSGSIKSLRNRKNELQDFNLDDGNLETQHNIHESDLPPNDT
jgi:hypothetical protein